MLPTCDGRYGGLRAYRSAGNPTSRVGQKPSSDQRHGLDIRTRILLPACAIGADGLEADLVSAERGHVYLRERVRPATSDKRVPFQHRRKVFPLLSRMMRAKSVPIDRRLQLPK